MAFGRGRSNGGAAPTRPGAAAASQVFRAPAPLGTASARQGVAAGSNVVRCSKLELIRMLAADLIEKIEESDEAQRLLLFMQLRNVQDSIATMKYANALLAAKSSKLAWVDTWNPVEGS